MQHASGITVSSAGGTICPAISQPDAATDVVDYDEAIEAAITSRSRRWSS